MQEFFFCFVWPGGSNTVGRYVFGLSGPSILGQDVRSGFDEQFSMFQRHQISFFFK